MRVLVTRAEPDGSATAGQLLARGHVPVLAPLSEIVATGAELPQGPIDLVVATSINALRCLDERRRMSLAGHRFAFVGARSAQLAREMGFADDAVVSPTAAALADTLCRSLPPASRLLYLAGTPRKPVLETRLGAAGHSVSVVEVYAVRGLQWLPEAAVRLLLSGEEAAVLHYSSDGALRFFALASACGATAQAISHLCLSPEVAAVLKGRVSGPILPAAEPNEASLLALLEVPR